MSYAQAANRPNPVAALGALGAPAAFGVLLVFGLAIKAGIEQRDTTLVGVTVPIDEPPPPPEPLPKPKDDTASKTVTDQVPQYLPPPRPDTQFTFDNSASGPITTLTGPGEVLGTRQTGLMEFRIAELPTHSHLLDQVQVLADTIRQSHPELAEPLIQRWTGSGQQFAKV